MATDIVLGAFCLLHYSIQMASQTVYPISIRGRKTRCRFRSKVKASLLLKVSYIAILYRHDDTERYQQYYSVKSDTISFLSCKNVYMDIVMLFILCTVLQQEIKLSFISCK